VICGGNETRRGTCQYACVLSHLPSPAPRCRRRLVIAPAAEPTRRRAWNQPSRAVCPGPRSRGSGDRRRPEHQADPAPRGSQRRAAPRGPRRASVRDCERGLTSGARPFFG